jgi:formyltetrahydrofolate-dependent phosphoribosylglycinamide formyltransferase
MTAAASRVRLAILASGGGSNAQAIIDYFGGDGDARAVEVVLVASNKADAGALAKARARGIPAAVIADPADGAALSALLDAHRAECIALAGYLKLVPREVTQRWRGRIVNVHPALLPKFGGAGMYGRRVHDAVLAAGETESGATVHHVDEQYDRGAIIAQERVPVKPGDTADSLAARVLHAEHHLYPRSIEALALSLQLALPPLTDS